MKYKESPGNHIRKKGLVKGFFLRDAKEIKEVFDKGIRYRQSGYKLLVLKTGQKSTCGNVIIAKRYGNAVERNRAKRRYRDIIIRLRNKLADGFKFVIIPHKSSHKVEFAFLMQNMEKFLKVKGIIKQ